MSEADAEARDSDSSLLELYAKQRDPGAFAQLVKRYSGLVYGTAFRLTGSPHVAEDVTQDCFLELACKASSITSCLTGWLHAAATHRSLDAKRRIKARQKHEERIQPQNADEAVPSWSEIGPQVDQALEELPEDLRVPLIMHYMEGRTQAEVAEALGLERSSVSRRLERGVEALRALLRHHGVLATAVLLAALLHQHAALAAPPSVAASAGKIGLAGIGRAAPAATAASAVAGKALLAAILAGAAAALLAVAALPPALPPPSPLPAAPVPAASVGLRVLARHAREVAWHPQDERIAYIGHDLARGEMAIGAVRSGQEAAEPETLLDRAAGVPLRHLSGLAWHPDGRQLAFVARNEDAGKQTEAGAHLGFDTNLWAFRLDDRRAFRLTQKPNSFLYWAHGAFNPRFTNDGKRLYWSEPLAPPSPGKPETRLGIWRLARAPWLSEDAGPALDAVEIRTPGTQAGYYQLCDVEPGTDRILICGNLAPGDSLEGMELYEYDWPGGTLTRLTDSPASVDTRARYAPGGRAIAWLLSEPLPAHELKPLDDPAWRTSRSNEIWRMNREGSDKRPLTRFSEPGHPDRVWIETQLGSAVEWICISDFSWSPDGAHLAAVITYRHPGREIDSVLVLLRLP